MRVEHEFETLIGDELSVDDLAGATWKVVETFVDRTYDVEGGITFTHRIELHATDDQIIGVIGGGDIGGQS